jgi:hypothetical protein
VAPLHGHAVRDRRTCLRANRRGRTPVVVISGGYGLALAGELIGFYDRRFQLTDWPRALLEDCLASIAEHLGVDQVLASCARSTDYAHLVRRVPWPVGVEALLVSPEMGGRGGAQVLVPRASGEAINAVLENALAVDWTSSDGIELRTERAR